MSRFPPVFCVTGLLYASSGSTAPIPPIDGVERAPNPIAAALDVPNGPRVLVRVPFLATRQDGQDSRFDSGTKRRHGTSCAAADSAAEEAFRGGAAKESKTTETRRGSGREAIQPAAKRLRSGRAAAEAAALCILRSVSIPRFPTLCHRLIHASEQSDWDYPVVCSTRPR